MANNVIDADVLPISFVSADVMVESTPTPKDVRIANNMHHSARQVRDRP